jgi:MHS family alpha-ketoglutarate permease-like MFS transporter
MGITAGGTASFYAYTVYMQKFLVNTSGFSRATASEIMTVALLILLVIQPLVGRLSDFTGRRPVMMAFGICGTLFAYPIFTTLAHTQNPIQAFAIVVGAMVMLTGYTSINAIVKAELFPTNIRALGVGLPYALTVAIFGGTAEYVALWFKQAGHESVFFYYVAGCVLISLLVYGFMRETSKDSVLDRD